MSDYKPAEAACVRQAHESDGAYGFAEATTRLIGLTANAYDGTPPTIGYLRGVERVLVDTLNRIRERIGYLETMEAIRAGSEQDFDPDEDRAP